MYIGLCRVLDMKYTRICKKTILHVHKLYLDLKLPGFEKTILDKDFYPKERIPLEKDDSDGYKAMIQSENDII